MLLVLIHICKWWGLFYNHSIAKSNNGIVRTKLLTFGVNVDDLSTARARLERVEADICGNFKKLGVKCRSLSGLERLELLHGQLHPGSGSPFRFSWDMIPKTGLSTKDFIAPDSFDFRFSRLFRVGTTWGAASYLQILASELSDKLLAELLEMDAEMTITLHIQTVDQAAAVKSIKAKVSDIDKMDCQHFFRQIFLGYFSDIVQAFDTLRTNVCGDDYTSLHNPIVLSSVLPAYGMFHSIQILFL